MLGKYVSRYKIECPRQVRWSILEAILDTNLARKSKCLTVYINWFSCRPRKGMVHLFQAFWLVGPFSVANQNA